MHKEIAIAKITAYLGRNPVVAANNLPDRVHQDANTPAIANVNEYRDYINYFRTPGHTDAHIDALVGEMQKAKVLAQIEV